METPKPQEGIWTLVAPNGDSWAADSPIKCCHEEQQERVPADVALDRIFSFVAEKPDGIELIANERQEQIEKHKFDSGHDDNHSNGELVDAACYILTSLPGFWPKSFQPKWEEKFANKKPGVETLKVAGALIAAEIDRLQRLNQ